nr:urease accessory UreF family protein [Oceanicoccus sp. KOV_DT_Chl]
MRHSMAHLDLPVLARLYSAWQVKDLTRVNEWNSYLLASRESAEFELEDVQMGRGLMRLLASLGVDEAAAWPRQYPASFATAFALAGVHWQVDQTSLMHGLCWSWLENQVAAATKLVPLGQTQAQQLLVALMTSVEQCCQQAMTLADDDIGAGLPALAIISAQHETQYSRLFRS